MAELSSTPKSPPKEIVVDHDAKSYSAPNGHHQKMMIGPTLTEELLVGCQTIDIIIKEHGDSKAVFQGRADLNVLPDRKSTRLNSSHRTISYAVFCLKKKNHK